MTSTDKASIVCETCGAEYLYTHEHICPGIKVPRKNRFSQESLISSNFIVIAIIAAVVTIGLIGWSISGMASGLSQTISGGSSSGAGSQTEQSAIEDSSGQSSPIALSDAQIAEGFDNSVSSDIAWRWLTKKENQSLTCGDSAGSCIGMHVLALNNCSNPTVTVDLSSSSSSDEPLETKTVAIAPSDKEGGIYAGQEAAVQIDFDTSGDGSVSVSSFTCN